MVNSLKEIIEGITRIVEANLPEITKVKYSGVMNTDLPRDFPTLYLFCEDPSTLNENHNLITLQMHFADVQISQNEEWKKDYEIKSDMMQTASKLFDLLEVEGWLDTINIPLQPFTHDMNDGLSGVQCSVPFIVEKPCIIEDYEQGTPTPEPVTITITSPITGEEFEEGTDITVSYSLSTEEGVTDVALEIDGVETQRKTVIFDAFLISGLDVNSHSIVLKAYNGEELLDTSNTVTVDVVQIPLTITILTPSEGAEYTEGDDVIVSYEFNREYTEVDKVEFWINGAKEVELSPPIGAAFGAVAGEMLIETRAVDVANNTLASDTVTVTVAAVFEAETTALMTALAIPNDENPSDYTGLTNAQIWTIVNNRFLGYKANGLLTELQAEWWMLGSTAAQHSYNALNPATFQLTWFGGWVHDKNGAFGNKSNTYASTGFIPSVEQDVNSNGLIFVAGASSSSSGIQCQIGTFTSVTKSSFVFLSLSGQLSVRLNGVLLQLANTDFIGNYSTYRNTGQTQGYKNGVEVFDLPTDGTLDSIEIFLGAVNQGGAANNFAAQRIQNAGCTAGLSDVQALAHQTLVDEFENALGRKTW